MRLKLLITRNKPPLSTVAIVTKEPIRKPIEHQQHHWVGWGLSFPSIIFIIRSAYPSNYQRLQPKQAVTKAHCVLSSHSLTQEIIIQHLRLSMTFQSLGAMSKLIPL